MTPTIDVLLVLLIIFTAIAPRQAVGLDALIPPSDQGEPRRAPENPVVLEIAPDGSYRVNSQLVQMQSLGALLVGIYARRGDRTLFVKGAPDLEFGTVARAIDVAHEADVERIALMPRPSLR